MKDCGEALPDDVQDLCIGLHGHSREIFRADENRSHGGGMKNLPRALIAGDNNCLVLWISEPVRIDDWWFGRVCRVNGDVAARVWRYKSHGDTGIVVAV